MSQLLCASFKTDVATSGTSTSANSNANQPSKEEITSQVAMYIEFLKELNEPEYKYIDFMSVLSSVMLLSDTPLESKIDLIFSYTALGKATAYHQTFTMDDFLIALRSFESGLSFAMGRKASSEQFVKDVAKQWLSIAKGNTSTSNSSFSGFPSSPSRSSPSKRNGGGVNLFEEAADEYSHAQVI